VNAAKGHEECATGWIMRRLRTAERLLSRFRSAGDAGTGKRGFVFAERRDDRGNEPPVSDGSRAGSSTRRGPGIEPLPAVSSAEPVRAAISLKEDDVRAAVPDIGNAGNEPDVQKNSLGNGVSGSIQRLVQRTGSPGAIDARPARRRYGRTGEWIARKSGLINRLESRVTQGENNPELNARQIASVYAQREAALSRQNPDEPGGADAVTKQAEEGMTLPGNRAFAWRYKPAKKDVPEGQGQIQRLPAQASHSASPAEKTSGNNEGPLPGPGYRAPKSDSSLPSAGDAPKANQPPAAGTFRLSRKRTSSASREPSSMDLQTSGQNFPAAPDELIQPKLPEQGAMLVAAKETSSTVLPDSKNGTSAPASSLISRGREGTAPLIGKPALPGAADEAGHGPARGDDHGRSGSQTLFRKPVVSPEIKTNRKRTQPASRESSSKDLRTSEQNFPPAPAAGRPEQGTGESGFSGKSFLAGAGPLTRADELIQPKFPEQGTMPLAAKEISSSALPDSKNGTSAPASSLISRGHEGTAPLNGRPTLPGAADEAGHGPAMRDDHGRSGSRTVFRKPVVSPEIKTKRIEEYEPNPDAFSREKTGPFGSGGPLSAVELMPLRNEAPDAAGSFTPEQAPHIAPVRLMRSRASGKSEGPARREASMGAISHEPGTAAELPAEKVLPRKTDIIWRKAAQTGEAGPFAGRGRAPYGSRTSFPPDTLMREASAPAQAEITAPARTSETPAAEIDLDRLAEQVSRVIARRIDIERERRGTGQWM
jgi:hypothetical protein